MLWTQRIIEYKREKQDDTKFKNGQPVMPKTYIYHWLTEIFEANTRKEARKEAAAKYPLPRYRLGKTSKRYGAA